MWHVFLCTSSACSEKRCVAYWYYATACYQLRDQQVSQEDYETIIMGLMPTNPAFNDAANKLDLIGQCVAIDFQTLPTHLQIDKNTLSLSLFRMATISLYINASHSVEPTEPIRRTELLTKNRKYTCGWALMGR